jgi:hypothetical protein
MAADEELVVERGSVRVTSHAVMRPPAKVKRQRDFRTVELFRFEHGRLPERGDGVAWHARERLIRANLNAQFTGPPQPDEHDGGRRRRRIAGRMLNRLAPVHVPVLASANGRTAAPQRRPRERRARARSPGRPGADDPHKPSELGRLRGRDGVVPGRVSGRWVA